MVEILELPADNNNNKNKPADTAATAPAAAAKPKALYVATPCYGCMMDIQFVQSLLWLQIQCMSRGIECFVDLIGNESLVQRARNILAARFYNNSKFTHMLFIDADIAFDPVTVFRCLDFDKDCVTAIYPKKAISWDVVESKLAEKSAEPLTQQGLDFNINITESVQAVDGFIPVLDAATGFMLISRTLLHKMYDVYRPTLHCVNDIMGGGPQRVETYVAVFDCMIDPVTRRYLSEDYAFSRRIQQIGGTVWADIASPLCHIGNYVYAGDIRTRARTSFD